MYLLGHQGWTDFMSQFGLYVHFARMYGSGTILVVDPNQLAFVRRLVLGTGIGVEQLELVQFGSGVCITCHNRANPIRCPVTGVGCRVPNLVRYRTIQGLCTFDNPTRWHPFLRSVLAQGRSFVEAFYEYHGLPIETMWNNFVVLRTPHDELPIPVSAPYLAYHMQAQYPIPLISLRKDLQQVSLDRLCPDFFGCLRILEGAREIHVIQSSYCMFLYLLQLKTGLFANTPIYVHASVRPNANTDYKNMNRHPQLPNWTFL